MVEIASTPEEMAAGRYSAEKVALARKALLEDGIVILHDVADVSHLSAIRERMLEDVARILTREDVPFNFNSGNLQQDPPPFAPYLFRDVLLNDLVIQVTHSVLGNGLYNAFYSGNTALARSTSRQPVHADLGHLWPDMEHATPGYGYVVNFPLVDMDASNGSTEMWPGTHLDTSCAFQDVDIKISEEKLEARRSVVPPVQPTVKLGSAVIRDIRMWHAGMPNPSDGHRPMIAMIHWVSWWPKDQGVPFPASAREFFDHPILWTNANFQETEIDHTRHGHAYEYQEA
jgi:hypothetical protein